jgi:hypothetical protein
MRLVTFHLRDKANAARIDLPARIKQALSGRTRIGAFGLMKAYRCRRPRSLSFQNLWARNVVMLRHRISLFRPTACAKPDMIKTRAKMARVTLSLSHYVM